MISGGNGLFPLFSKRPVKSLASYSTTQLEDGVQFVLAGWYRRKGDRMKQARMKLRRERLEKEAFLWLHTSSNGA